MEGSMRQHWIASALFLTIWLGLIGLITWFAVQDGFLYFPWWISGGMLLGVVAMALLLCWESGLQRIRRIPLLVGAVWLLMLPFIPFNAHQGLILRRNLILNGMSETRVRMVMGNYRWHKSESGDAAGVEHLHFCNDLD
jgi:hypothetical protein